MAQPTQVRDAMTQEERLVQIIKLYQDRYISLASAKGLVWRYTPELANRVSWLAVKRI